MSVYEIGRTFYRAPKDPNAFMDSGQELTELKRGTQVVAWHGWAQMLISTPAGPQGLSIRVEVPADASGHPPFAAFDKAAEARVKAVEAELNKPRIATASARPPMPGGNY